MRSRWLGRCQCLSCRCRRRAVAGDLHRQDPSDAHPQLDYGFASRPIAHRLTVRALNAPKDWGPSDHCRIVIDLEET